MKLLLLRVKKNMTKDKLLKIVNGIEINQDMLEDQVNSVYLAIGSNLGNKVQNLQKSIYQLSRKVSILKFLDIMKPHHGQIKKNQNLLML